MIKYALVLSLAGTPALALEETVELSSEGVWESSSASITGASLAEVSTTLVAVSIVGSVIYLWNAAQTRRAYRRAADEGRASLSGKDQRPLTSAPQNSTLRAVAEVEREVLRREGRDPSLLSEVALVRAIIHHAELINAHGAG